MHRARQFRLYPTPEQEVSLRQFAGASRFIYNIALEQRRDWWRQYRATTGKAISWLSQSKELTELRREVEWLSAVPRSVCQQALRDLDRSFASLFSGRAGFPQFRNCRDHRSFRVEGRECSVRILNRKWAALQLPKLGEVKLRLTRGIPEDLANVTVRQSGLGWVVAFVGTIVQSAERAAGVVGIDRGVANTLSLSNGEQHSIPTSIASAICARKRAQRVLARRKKGSRRRMKQRFAVAELHRRAAASRAHWLHERSTDIARRFSTVAIEALKVANMTRSGTGKRGLNRSILEQGWSIFANMLAYKLEDRGSTLHLVNPAYTSQTCAECGSVNAKSRKSQAVFECVDCGHAAHADTNAAINILRRSPAGVEGTGCCPVEARTGKMRKHLENLAA